MAKYGLLWIEKLGLIFIGRKLRTRSIYQPKLTIQTFAYVHPEKPARIIIKKLEERMGYKRILQSISGPLKALYVVNIKVRILWEN